jgi:hypothetical protein
MEVSHATSETQAVAIGINGQAEEVTVSTDAEFMMTIAHGIYSNKALALVRELLCNARDGHAKAGCMEKPIIITLTENLLVVRDHGTGIPNAIFAKTYMTFGKSTKRQDKAATGGFGVGTKVPWAVCDVFSGRNYIDGTMTAYSIVKSDPTMEGKPTCTPVMTIPSTEPSGVEVSVPFPEKMRDDIRNFILCFVEELGIPVMLNGSLQQPSGQYREEELRQHGFVRLPHHPKTVIQMSNFYVRQGDVIYPIESQDDFSDAYEMLSYLNPNAGREPILFMAEPDSIIPTLSRESLQYTDRTSGSIRDLMKKALQELADKVDEYAERTQTYFPAYLERRADFLQATWNHNFNAAGQLSEAHRHHIQMPTASRSQNDMLMNNMARWLSQRTPYLETKVTVGKKFREDFEAKLKGIFLDQLKKFTYMDHSRLVEIWNNEGLGSYNGDKEFKKKLLRNTYEEVMFFREEIRGNSDILEVYMPKTADFRNGLHASRVSTHFIEIMQLKDIDTKKENLFGSYNDWLHNALYAANTVVLSTTPTAMLQRAEETLRENRDNVLAPRGPARLVGARCVRLKAGVKPHEIDKLVARYKAFGYDVITLLEPTKAELEERERLAAERAKLKEIPLPMLHSLIKDELPKTPYDEFKKRRRHIDGLVKDEAMKGEPLYYILPRGKDLSYNMKSFEDLCRLTKFVGTDILCVSTKPEIARVIKEGRRSLEDALLDFAKWFFHKPGIHEKLFYRGTFFVKRAAQDKFLTKLLFNRLPPQMDAEEERIYAGLKQLSGLFTELARYLRTKEELYSACSPATHYKRLFSEYADSHFCDVHRALDKAYEAKPSPQRALARTILKTILKERPA